MQGRTARAQAVGDGQKVADMNPYKARKGSRPLGAPCEVDADCWDGEPGGSIFCHTKDTQFFRWTSDVNKGKKGSTRYSHSDAQESLDKFGKLENFVWPATKTCRRRCGEAGKANSRYENVKDEYGTAWIGSAYGDSNTYSDARLRSGLGVGIGAWAGLGVGALIGKAVSSAVNAGFIDSMKKQAQKFLKGSNTNTFECGFQQRWKDRDEDLILNPVFERMDKHDDTMDGYVCDFDNKVCETHKDKASCEAAKVPKSKASCYWNEDTKTCSSFLYEYKDCGSAFCKGNEHSGGALMCMENCGWKKGYEARNGAMWTGGGNYPSSDNSQAGRRGYTDWEQTTASGYVCYEGPRKSGPPTIKTYKGTKYKVWETGKDVEVGVGCCLLRHDCSESGLGGSGMDRRTKQTNNTTYAQTTTRGIVCRAKLINGGIR